MGKPVEAPPGSEVRARAVPKKRTLRTKARPKSTRTLFRFIRINGSRAVGIRTPHLFLFSNLNDKEAVLGALRVQGLFNLAGGVLIEVSLAFPWLLVGSILHSPFDLDMGKWFVPWLISLGGLLAVISRYGGILTLAGVFVYANSHYITFCGAFECQVNSTWGPGFYLALAGATVSLAGRSWNFPVQWMDQRKGIGATLFSTGITALGPGALLTMQGFSGSLAVEETIPAITLLTSGLLMTAIGLGLFLSWRTPFNIRKIRRLLHVLFGRRKPL